MPTNIPKKWLVLSVVTLVAFVTNLDATIVVVGLPRMVQSLHTTVTLGLWTLTSYIIASTVFLLPAGRWADQFGTKKIFMLGLGLFTVATFLCGVAPNGALLLTFRVIQGTGAAFSLATATPIIVRTFPSQELGRAIGINSISWVMGSIVGPVAGGILVSTLGWRSIFFVAIPLGLAGVIGAAVVLKDIPSTVDTRSDGLGALSFGVGLTGLLVSLSLGQRWGWLSFTTLGLIALSVLLFVVFVRIESHHPAPMFDLRLLSHHHYRAGLGVTLGYSIGFFATTFLLTLYLQGAIHLSPIQAGLMFVPLSAPQLVVGPWGGALADRYGPARLIIGGVAILIVAAVWLSRLAGHFWAGSVIIPLALMSVANGLAWPALTKAVMSSAPKDRTGAASGMFYTFRNVGMSLSFTLSLVAAETSLPPSIATQVFLGQGILNSRLVGALVHATDAGFAFFVIFYALALVMAIPLLRPSHHPHSDAARSSG